MTSNSEGNPVGTDVPTSAAPGEQAPTGPAADDPPRQGPPVSPGRDELTRDLELVLTRLDVELRTPQLLDLAGWVRTYGDKRWRDGRTTGRHENQDEVGRLKASVQRARRRR